MFHNCENEQEAKKLFKKLALRLHPDCGGSDEFMVLLKESYEIHLNYFNIKNEYENQKEKKFDDTNGNKKVIYISDPRIAQMFDDFDKKVIPPSSQKFYDSVSEYLDKFGYITEKQYLTMLRILERSVNKEEYANT